MGVKRKRKIKKSFLFSVAGLLLLGLIALMEKRGADKVVQAIEVYLQDSGSAYFVDEAEIVQLLENEFPALKPGNSLKGIQLGKIEGMVESHPFVKNAEVFMDLKGNIVVKIEQYRPVARVLRPMAAHGYVSVEGAVLPTSPKYTARVLTVEGPLADVLLNEEELYPEYADLMELIHFIVQDDFWRAQITGLEVDGKKNIKMYQQVGRQVIEFGKPVDIEEKFKKIDLFYKEVLPVRGWDTYKRVNVKYKDQIICE